ncbi:MAG TPA: glycosyltransferase [Blastocatellia bacterium]|nr:glycosyltransferase [Blastocatellia bacterium]
MALGSKTRRVLLVLPVAEQGGAESLWVDFLRRYDRRRLIPSVVFLRDGPLVERVMELGVETFVQPITRLSNPINYAQAVWKIRRIIERVRAEVIFSSLGYGHLYGGMAARLARRPAVWWQHGVARVENLIDRWASRIPAQMIIASSEVAATAQCRAFGTKREKLRVIYPGVDMERLASPDPSRVDDLRQQLGLERACGVIATIGRLEPGKGQDDFLRAARRVQLTCKDARFLVVGSEMFGMNRGYEAQLRRMALDLGLGQSVIFTGFRRDISELLAVCDILVHAARSPESFGLVLVEAAASGKPVVATDVGGPREIVVHERTGILVPPGQPEMLAQAITGLLKNPERCRTMGVAASRHARERFDISRAVEQIHDVIEHVAAA